MKKLLLLAAFIPLFCSAQNFDVNVNVGACPFTISDLNGTALWLVPNTKKYYYNSHTYSGTATCVGGSVSYTRLKHLDFGVSYKYNNAITTTNALGVFADYKIRNGKNILAIGISVDGQSYTSRDVPFDGVNPSFTENFSSSIAIGARILYKRKVSDHFFVSALINPSFTNCNITEQLSAYNSYQMSYRLIFIPCTVGVSYRF